MRHRDTRSRTDLTREVDEARDQLGAEAQEMEKGVSDTEIVEGTRRAVRDGLTLEGREAADRHLGEAEDIARNYARDHDEKAGELHREGEDRERELDGIIGSTKETESTVTCTSTSPLSVQSSPSKRSKKRTRSSAACRNGTRQSASHANGSLSR